MAHNFQGVYNYYISKAGYPGNNGTADTPYHLPGIGGGGTTGIGAGVYVLPYNILQYTFLFAEGTVVVKVPAGLKYFTHSNYTANNISFEVEGNLGYEGGYSNVNQGYIDCKIIGKSATAQLFTTPYNVAGNYSAQGPPILSSCLVFDMQYDTLVNMPWTVTKSYFFGGAYNIYTLNDSYTNEAATIYVLNPQDCRNNNIRGKIVVAGTQFTSLAAAKAFNSTWFPNCINAAPGFNNEFAQDYSLTVNSVHNTLSIGPASLRVASSIFLVGPVGDVTATSGHYYLDSSTGLQVPIIWTDGNIVCTQQGGQNRLKVREAVGGALKGVYRTGLHVLGDTPQEVVFVNFLGGQNFNTDLPTDEALFDPNNPEPSNSNVPNARNYTSGHAGRNPNRWELDVWFGNKDNADINDPTHFVNGATPISIEWNGTPLYNPLTMIGNGSPGFDAKATGGNAPRKIQAKYMVYQVTLDNSYWSH